MDKKISPTAWSRFEQKYKIDLASGCWLWTACRGHRGYGLFALDGHRTIHAHRASWVLNVGEIPDGMLVCHKCDVPACVNPEHLFVGTSLDNNRDMLAKGRGIFPGRPKQTHCSKGHEFTPEGTYFLQTGKRATKGWINRLCLKCKLERDRALKAVWRSENRDEYNTSMRAYRLRKKIEARHAN